MKVKLVTFYLLACLAPHLCHVHTVSGDAAYCLTQHFDNNGRGGVLNDKLKCVFSTYLYVNTYTLY